MRQSQLFPKTRREAPKDEVAKNAQWLIRAGFVHKEMAGVYSYLPLGLLALEKINRLIRREMNAIGAVEVNLATLQNPEPWQKTGRWSDEVMDNWFKTTLKNGGEAGLAATHEEPLTALLRAHIESYRDLPRAVYQIQKKFRNETRTKSGLLRGREFLMKDLYSFHADKEDQEKFYHQVQESYGRILKEAGLGDRTYFTFASGGSFSQSSHEFQTLAAGGEDTIYLAADKKVAVNVEIATPEILASLGLDKNELVPHQAIEVGNIFALGTRFSEALGLSYLDQNGVSRPVWMGSYGLGPSRLLGTMAEVLSDERGLIWPRTVAPFNLHLLALAGKSDKASQAAGKLYRSLTKAGIEVLWDDRDAPAGEKFADADLIGLPFRAVVSEKTLLAGKWEVKNRQTGETVNLSERDLLNLLHA